MKAKFTLEAKVQSKWQVIKIEVIDLGVSKEYQFKFKFGPFRPTAIIRVRVDPV